jgi:aspartyl-tRNA(Asn)/glutamyl-tRNA(Gln) amidotransferase subunit C
MSKLTHEDVLKLAELARLELTADEIERMMRDLPSILEYVEQLDDVDTTGLEPTLQVTNLSNVTRPDEVIDYGYQPADLMKNLPAMRDGQIEVKRILE